jgi:hypothetical protein
MQFKLKYGSNFSLSDGNQTFTITDTKSKGIIEVVTENETNEVSISGYQFLLTMEHHCVHNQEVEIQN